MRSLLYALLFVIGLLRAEDVITIGLIGDSTVATQSGWGPAFAASFKEGVVVHNHAVNGATLESLSKRLPKLLALKPDYVLIQFGHNDQKRYDPAAYSEKLADYIKRVKATGAQPIVVSSVVRRTFGEDGKVAQPIPDSPKFPLKHTLTEYAEAAQAIATKMDVPFIDLHRLSMAHHNTIGREESQTYDFKEGDSTHFNAKGGRAIVGLIVPELIGIVPDLKSHLK